MARPAEGCEILLEGLHFRTHDELAMRQDARDRVIDGTAETAALGGNIDEGNRRGVETGVLVHRLHNFKARRASAGDAARTFTMRGLDLRRRGLKAFDGDL